MCGPGNSNTIFLGMLLRVYSSEKLQKYYMGRGWYGYGKEVVWVLHGFGYGLAWMRGGMGMGLYEDWLGLGQGVF